MYKKLKVYYLSTTLPFVMLLIGSAIFHKQINNTLANNPHPQINYAIFVLIVTGAIFILVNLRKLMLEGNKLAEFSLALRAGAEPGKLQSLALSYEADVAYVLRMIASSAGRAITHREQITIEEELSKAATRLNNRHTLPQFITNLLVGMGLLGTFIGLLATLGDIADLVSSFANLDPNNAKPIEVFQNMVSRMKAPMSSMGIAFSASLYGLLGSIILGFMMVSVRRCMQDVISLLGSEVAQHIEFSLVHERRGRRRDDDVRTIDDSSPALGSCQAGAGAADGHDRSDEIRILHRIEERISESSRIQEQALKNEMEQFSKQRGEFLRVVAEHSEAVNLFRSEMQRVGQQLGTLMNVTDRGNTELQSQLNTVTSGLIQSANLQGQKLAVVGDLMARMADDSYETRRILAVMLERGVNATPHATHDSLTKAIQTAFEQAAMQLLPKAPQGAK